MTRDGTGPSGPAGPTPGNPDPGPTGPGRSLQIERTEFLIGARLDGRLVAYAVRDAYGWTALRRQAGTRRFVGRHIDTTEAAVTLLTFYASRYILRERISGRLRIA